MRITRSVLCASVLLSSGITFAQSAWVVGSLPRVGPSDAPGTATNIWVRAAKGEAESFQVIVSAPASGLSAVNLTASDLIGPGGATISQRNLTFYREYYVYVSKPSPDYGVGNRPLGAGWYPDGLIPFTNPATGAALSGATLTAVPYHIPPNQNQPFWIDINVPRTAVAGPYSGTITVTSAQRSWTIGVNLQVWNFTLPVASNLKSSFGFHGSANNLANDQVLLQHRIQPFVMNASDLPALKADGVEIVGLPFFNESNGCAINAPPPVATIQSVMAQYPGFPSYVYPADEVTGCANVQSSLRAWAQAAHAAGTKTLVTVVPDPALLDDGTGTGRSDVDIWVILPRQYCANIDQFPCVVTPSIPAVQAKGDEVWSYNELEQDEYSPKWLLDFAPINYRIFPGFIGQQFGFTGLLYAYVAYWSSDPWNNVEAGDGFPGDDMLVYPGQQVGLTTVQPSMRLKYIRDGVDDYDYMAMLKAQGQGAFIEQVLAGVAPDWQNWTKDPSALENARIQLGQRLDQLAGGSWTLPAPGLSSPLNSSTGEPVTLSVQWMAVSGASQYQVYLGTNASSLALSATINAPATAATFTNLAAAATYYWKVVALAGNASASSTLWSFTTAAPPTPTIAASTLVWPANGSTGNTTSLNVQWSPVTGATKYQVYFGSTATSLALYATVNAPAVNAALYNLNGGATYYWRIVAVAGNASASSAVWSFTTAAPRPMIAAPTLVWPANASTGNTASLNVQWSPVTGAKQYQVYFGSSATSLSLYATVNAPAVNAALYNLNGGATYYWKVVAVAGTASAGSAVWSFKTAAPPTPTITAPTLVWPANASTGNTTSLNVQWSPVTGATQYQVYFGSSATSLALYATVNVPAVNAALYNLPSGATCYWRVVAVAAGASASSPVWSFTTN